MKRAYVDIARHSAVYGFGQVLMRVASILLLPVYTRYLRPADYGIVSILDFAGSVLATVAAAGFVAAAARYHFERPDERWRDGVWWTALTLLAVITTFVLLPVWLYRADFSTLLLGADVPRRSLYMALAVPTIWLGIIEQYLVSYLRVRKWSAVFVVVSVSRLLTNIALNLLFLVGAGWGVAGLLAGNLVTGCLVTVALLVVFVSQLGSYTVDRQIAGRLWSYAWPLVPSGLLALVLNQADRYLLRIFSNLADVGIYSMACQVGQAVTFLVVIPFISIWRVVIYEVSGQEDATTIYAEVFRYYVYGLSLLLLGVSLFADPIMRLIAAPDYHQAGHLIPIICLASLFYSLHDHFCVPALVRKKTTTLVPVYGAAAVLTLLLDIWLLPRFGSMAASWVKAVGFAGFSLFGLLRYRRIEVYPYPFRSCLAVFAGMVVTYLAVAELSRYLTAFEGHALSALALVAWTGALGARLLVRFTRARTPYDAAVETADIATPLSAMDEM